MKRPTKSASRDTFPAVSLIIAAGGAGTRFAGAPLQSKLFYKLNGKPVLSHALEAFQGIPQIREILLAVPPGTENWIKTRILRDESRGGVAPPSGRGDRAPTIHLVRGGRTRAESVWNALRKTSSKHEWVLVHDGARPFPPRDAVLKMIHEATGDGVILARPVVPTLKRVSSSNGRIVETVDRTHLFEAETPQLMRRSLLLKAYQNPKALQATDESSLIESVGGRVKVMTHSGWNVKVTTQEDLHLAEAFHRRGGVTPPSGRGDRAPTITVGFGEDTHRLVSGRPFKLGGIRIPFHKGPLGHSDGDALLHATGDAILGALGMGDIGEWFSDQNPKYKNVPSAQFLERILKDKKTNQWQIERVDTIVFLEKPKLGPYKARIQKQIAKILKVPQESVSIKAKTMEGLGPVGEGRAITCKALVLLCRGGVTPPSGRGDRAPTFRNSI